MKNRLFLLMAIASCMCSCTGIKSVVNEKSDSINSDKIVFHTFIAKKISDTLTIEETEKVLRDGQVKELFNQAGKFHHPVEVVFLDPGGKRLKSMFTEHPLIQEYEYANDDGKLNRITNFADSASFTLRYNKIDNINSIYFISSEKENLHININLEIK